MNKIPEWLAKNYTCDHTPIEKYYNRQKSKFLVQRTTDIQSEEAFHIADIKRLDSSLSSLKGKDYRKAIAEIRLHTDWLFNYWQRIGLPKFLFCEGNKYGLNNIYGEITLKPIYDEIKLDYDDWNLIFQSEIIVRRDDKWGIVKTDRNIVVSFEYEDIFRYEGLSTFVVKKGGKFGIIQWNPICNKYEVYIKCEMDNIFHHIDVMNDLIIFEKNGKFGWKGCQFPENDSDAEFDVVYLPTENYYCSDDYDDEICSFIAVKNGEYHEIEWFTEK